MGKLTVPAVSSRHAFHYAFMKSHLTSPESQLAILSVASRRFMAPANAVVAILALLIVSLPAQSAANFKKQAAKPDASAPAANSKPSEILASRYVTAEQLPSHVNAISDIMTIRKRVTDPFGQYQDPNARPIVKTTVAKVKRFTPSQATPFSDIVRLIKVTTIMPAEKRFLVGTRTFKEGDHIPLSFRGKHIKVEVASVTSGVIAFRNLENGDQATIQLNLLPVGMTPGNNGITAPGMVPDRPDAPIDLDADPL